MENICGLSIKNLGREPFTIVNAHIERVVVPTLVLYAVTHMFHKVITFNAQV